MLSGLTDQKIFSFMYRHNFQFKEFDIPEAISHLMQYFYLVISALRGQLTSYRSRNKQGCQSGALLNKSNFDHSFPFLSDHWILTGTGIPRPTMLLSGTALIHVSDFCYVSLRINSNKGT